MSIMANPLIANFLANQTATTPPFLGTSIAMPSAVPSMGAPVLPSVSLAPAPPPTRLQTDQDKLDYYKDTGSGVDQVQNPLLRGIARAADIAGSVFAPKLAQFIPGTTLHHQLLMGQAENNVKNDEAQAQAAAQTANETAGTAHTNAETGAITAPNYTPLQTDSGIAAFNHKTGLANPVMGADGTQVGAPDKTPKPLSIEERAYDYAVKSGKNPLDAYGAVYGAKNTKDAGLPQQYLDAIASGDATKAGLIKQVIHDTNVQPKIDVHAAEAPRDVGTWTPGFDKDKNPILFNSKTGEVKPNAVGFTKATAAGAKLSSDEQKRADLAQNMNENINSLEEIATRRPELFGPVNGRMTDLKTAVGTSDPDVAALQTIKHQLGMVAQGAHGMRSAQGVESAANSLVNSYHNSPEATKASLETARKSVQTFLSDANNPGASRGTGDAPPMIRALDPQGNLHEAPQGTPLPAGWKAQ